MSNKIIPNMLYKVEFLSPFVDGNMPAGFVRFKQGQIVEDIPGHVLARMLASGPDDIEVLGEMIPPPDVSDAAREMAEEHGIDLTQIEGTGKHGNIIKADIEALIEPEA